VAAEFKRRSSGPGALTYTLIALVVLGTAGFWIVQVMSKKAAPLKLSAAARAYVPNLKLSDVRIKAADSYLNQTVVEIDGRITNGGPRTLDTVEITCVFYDAYGQVVLRQRLPIVADRAGPLKPSETRDFRLPFDNLPESWNHQLPQLVIAAIKFS
jgi:hypothetical protein